MGGDYSTEELRDRLPRVQPVEVLGPAYFCTGHIPRAVNIPPHRVSELAASLLPDKDTAVVVYAEHRGSSAADVVVRQLGSLGYRDVSRYADGKEGWVSAGLPLVRGPADDVRTAAPGADAGATIRGGGAPAARERGRSSGRDAH